MHRKTPIIAAQPLQGPCSVEPVLGHVLLELQSNSSELRRWSVLDFLMFYDENTEFRFISMTMFAFLIVYEL
jgi:hypothetical protein